MADEELRLLEERTAAISSQDGFLTKLYWPVRALALLGGFALGAFFTRDWNQGMAKAVFRGGELLEDWKFESVNVNSGDKVYDFLFNHTLFECIEPVKTKAVQRGRCYDSIFERQHRCLRLRKEDPPASCHRTVQCLKGLPHEQMMNPCKWLCTGGSADQNQAKAKCEDSMYDAELWGGKCLEHGYQDKRVEAIEAVNVWSQRCVDETTTTTTRVGSDLFCWALVVPWTNEVDLLIMQQRVQKGIFECDAHEIYSDRKMHIGGIDTVHVDTDLHCKMNKLTLTVENTNIFRAVWKKVLDRMTWRNYDWTVKADLDSVFVPKRLISYVQDNWIRQHAQTGTGLWLNNCWRGLHGPIEVMSKQAMQIYNDRWMQCQIVGQQKPQEDVYLQECMSHLGIWKADLDHLLAEDHCDHHDFYKCEGNFVAYHPFKSEKEWMDCRNKLD